MNLARQKWIRHFRVNGGVINNVIVMGAAEGIVQKQQPSILKAHGGAVDISKSLAKSILRRMGFVKRKGTRTVKRLPADFDDIKAANVEREVGGR